MFLCQPDRFPVSKNEPKGDRSLKSKEWDKTRGYLGILSAHPLLLQTLRKDHPITQYTYV